MTTEPNTPGLQEPSVLQLIADNIAALAKTDIDTIALIRSLMRRIERLERTETTTSRKEAP